MFIIDAHEDIAYNALAWGRDIRLSVHKVRMLEEQQARENASLHGYIAMSGLPELRRGGFSVIFGAIFTLPRNSIQGHTGPLAQSYRDVEEAYQAARQQLTYYHDLATEPGISLILKRGDLLKILRDWENSSEEDEQRPLGIIPMMEGADPIRTPHEVAEWFAHGIRIIGLAWAQTRYAGGNFGPGPLTSLGKELLTEMQRRGIILDTSHMAEETFWQSLDHFSGPVIASHSNCRAITVGERLSGGTIDYKLVERQLSDGMILKLTQRGGVIGIVPMNRYLNGEWSRHHRFTIGLDQMVQHIDHICQLTGNSLHVGLGSDVDGGFGRDETPVELDTIADLRKLADALDKANYSQEDIENIMGKNWQRFLEKSLPE